MFREVKSYALQPHHHPRITGADRSCVSGRQGADIIPDPPVEGIKDAIANMSKY